MRSYFCLKLAVALVLAVVFVGGGEALAAEPWWHVNTSYAPPSKPGGEGTLLAEVTNLGDVPTAGTYFEHLLEAAFRNETNGFIEIVDKLPPGLTMTGVQSVKPVQTEGDADQLGSYERQLHETLNESFCSVVEQTVTCLYGAPVRPYERMIVMINVKALPGAAPGLNEVSVAGGGAAPVTSRRTIEPAETPAYGVQTYEVTPEEEGGAVDTRAGSHPFQLTTTFTLDTQSNQVFKQEAAGPGGEGLVPEAQPLTLTKDLRFHLPPGLIGDAAPLPKCSLLVFTRSVEVSSQGAQQCPNDTVVGVAQPIITNNTKNQDVPYVTTSPLFNLEPAVGEPARFGFGTVLGPVILDTSVQAGGDYGVEVTVPNILDLPFLGSQVTLWGTPADPRHDGSRGTKCLGDYEAKVGEEAVTELSCPAGASSQPFLIMPTSCTGPLDTTAEADSWSRPGVYSAPAEYTFQNGAGGIGEPYGLDGCNKLSFEPSISVSPDGQQGSTPSGLTVSEHVPQESGLNPAGLADSTVKDTTVTLPAGVAIDPAGADGLAACSEADVSLDSPGEQACPEASKIGTLEIKTPLLPNPLVGAAYLAQQNANPFGSLIAMYLVAYDPVSGVRIKLAGQVTPDPVTGQLVSTFKNTPQLPFEDLKLHFFGGSRAPLGTPALCGGYVTTASIVPWSGNPPVESASEFQITSGPNGTPCFNPLPFAPTLTAGSTNVQAGSFTPFTTTMSREDGNQNLQGIQLHMPPGLSGLLSGVKLCGEAQADAGTCGPESLVGETIVSVGLGGSPFSVRGGRVYITGPYEGAPFGLSIVDPAKAGPFDLGQVVVRAKIEVDPYTAALTITTDDTGPYKIPTIIDGIPLQIKHVNVTINRSGFTFNPTNCDKLAITGSLQSTEGATQALSIPFQVTNCASMKFEPKFAASTSGKTSRADGASLNVKLTYPEVAFGSQANIKQVKVELPRVLPSRLSTLQKACTAAQFHLNPAGCPSASIVGHAKAITPLIPVPLEGPAYFVSNGGEAFPNLVVVLQGYGVTIDLVGDTFISKAGITSSTFKAVPDAPVGSFELNLPEGQFSALTADGNLCRQKLVIPTEFVAQNGATLDQSTHVEVEGCGELAVVAHTVRGRTLTLSVYAPSAGTVVASGKGLRAASKPTHGRETVTLTLHQRKMGRLKTRVQLSFTPSVGRERRKQAKSLAVRFKQ